MDYRWAAIISTGQSRTHTHKHTCTHTSWCLVLGRATTKNTIRAYNLTIKRPHMERQQTYIIIIIIVLCLEIVLSAQ